VTFKSEVNGFMKAQVEVNDSTQRSIDELMEMNRRLVENNRSLLTRLITLERVSHPGPPDSRTGKPDYRGYSVDTGPEIHLRTTPTYP
jgi:hypothetical protein